MKTFSFLFGLIGFFQFFIPITFADNAAPQVFVREGCAHCADEKEFIKKENINVRYIDIYANDENKNLFDEFTNQVGLPKITPLTLVGNTIIQGYANDDTTGKTIKTLLEKENMTIEEAILNPEKVLFGAMEEGCNENNDECKISPLDMLGVVEVPLLGEVDIKQASLYTVSFLIGFLDGFNPCAMWVLVIFLITLIQIGDRKKMAMIAGTFLMAEGIMYGLILVSWWKFFDFVGFDSIVQPIVSLIALGGGIFFIYSGLTSNGTCNVTNMEQQKSISEKINELAHSPFGIASFIGVLGLALSVNIIEFACSFGYPQVFTQILHSSDFFFTEKVVALIIYIGAYMIDDLIVFGIALVSIEKLGITQQYSKASNILGGILMIILSIAMFFGAV